MEEIERVVESIRNNSSTDSGSQPSSSQRQKRELYRKGQSIDEEMNGQSDNEISLRRLTNAADKLNSATRAPTAVTEVAAAVQRAESPVYDTQSQVIPSQDIQSANVASQSQHNDTFDALRNDTSTNNPLHKPRPKPRPKSKQPRRPAISDSSDSDDSNDQEFVDARSEQSAELQRLADASVPPTALDSIGATAITQNAIEIDRTDSPTVDMEPLNYDTDASSHRTVVLLTLNNDGHASSVDEPSNVSAKSSKTPKTGKLEKAPSKRSSANKSHNRSKKNKRRSKKLSIDGVNKAGPSGEHRKTAKKSQERSKPSAAISDEDVDSEIDLNLPGTSHGNASHRSSGKKKSSKMQASSLEREGETIEAVDLPPNEPAAEPPATDQPLVEDAAIEGPTAGDHDTVAANTTESANEKPENVKKSKQSARTKQKKTPQPMSIASKTKSTIPLETAVRSPRPIRNKPPIEYWKVNDVGYMAKVNLKTQNALNKLKQRKRRSRSLAPTNVKRPFTHSKTNRNNQAVPSKRAKNIDDDAMDDDDTDDELPPTKLQKWLDKLCDPAYDALESSRQIDLRFHTLNNGEKVGECAHIL